MTFVMLSNLSGYINGEVYLYFWGTFLEETAILLLVANNPSNHSTFERIS